MVHLKCFRFCFVSFLFCILGFNLTSQEHDFDYYVNIALKNSITYDKARTNQAINRLEILELKYRYFPLLSSSVNYLANFDNKLQDIIHSIDGDISFIQALPLGLNFSVSLDNDLTIMKLDSLKMLYSFSGNINLSIPFYLASPSLLRYYAYFDNKINGLYDEYYNVELENAQNSIRLQVAQYIGLYLLQKQYLEIQKRQIEIDHDSLLRDEALLEQGKLSINDFEERNTARYENQLKVLNLQYKFEQCEKVLKTLSLDEVVLSLNLDDWIDVLENYITNKHKAIDYQYEMQKLLTSISAYSTVSSQTNKLPRLNVSVLVKPMSKTNGAGNLVETMKDYWNKTSQYNISVAIGMNIPFSPFDDSFHTEKIISKQMKLYELTKQELLQDFEIKQSLRELSLELLQESIEVSIQNLENIQNRTDYVTMRFEQGYVSQIDFQNQLIQKNLAELRCDEATLEYFNALLAY